jgi:hypothetical protein
MEVGWGTSLRAGIHMFLRAGIHTFSVQASHALFDLSGVTGGPKLSLSGVHLLIGDLLPIRTEFEHLLVRSDDDDDDDDDLWVLH